MIRIKVTWPLVLLVLLALLLLRQPPQRRARPASPAPIPSRPRSHRRAGAARPTVIDGSIQESADREVADRAHRAYEAAADSPFADALQLLKSRGHARVHANA